MRLSARSPDRLLASADLVITVGYNPIEFWPALWNAGKDRKIIHIDVREPDLDVEYCPYVELTGDIAQTLATLTPMVNRASMSALSEQMLRSIASEWTRLAEEAAGKDGTPIHPIRLVAELQKVLDTDVTLCLDMGSFHLWIARHLYSFRARPGPDQQWPTDARCGLAVGYRGISRPAPREGDLDLGRWRLPVLRHGAGNGRSPQMQLVHMVWIDGTYDMVAVQEIAKYGRSSGCELGPVDPVKYAEAFGATGMMIRTPDEIAPTLRKAMATTGPVVIGVHVDYRDNHKLFELVDERSIH